jgi:hypothetical protein
VKRATAPINRTGFGIHDLSPCENLQMSEARDSAQALLFQWMNFLIDKNDQNWIVWWQFAINRQDWPAIAQLPIARS